MAGCGSLSVEPMMIEALDFLRGHMALLSGAQRNDEDSAPTADLKYISRLIACQPAARRSSGPKRGSNGRSLTGSEACSIVAE